MNDFCLVGSKPIEVEPGTVEELKIIINSVLRNTDLSQDNEKEKTIKYINAQIDYLILQKKTKGNKAE